MTLHSHNFRPLVLCLLGHKQTAETTFGVGFPYPKVIQMELKLSNGGVTLVDAEDYPLLSRYAWHHHKKANREVSYVYSSAFHGRNMAIHRLIMAPGIRFQIDHIDGNGLNNQKSNLRICTQSENARNRPCPNTNKSGHSGVYFRWNKWHAQITVQQKTIYLGKFPTIEEAIAIRRAKEVELFGEFSFHNREQLIRQW